MAYRSRHCSATLRYFVCISVFCTLLALFVLFPFVLSAPCPFNAPFLFYTFLLLHSTSFFTPQSHPTTTSISSLFNIFIVSVHLVHEICFFLFHPLHIGVFSPLHSSTTIPSLVCQVISLCSASPPHCECSA
jgi:hypothetical protein